MESSLDIHTNGNGRYVIFSGIFAVLSVVLLLALTWALTRPAPVAAAVKHTMPTTVDVNGINWRVEVVDDLAITGVPAAYAYTRCNIHVVSIKRGSPNYRKLLWHELSHASVCAFIDGDFIPNNLYFNSTTAIAHEGIYNFSDVWSELFYRNPDLAAYLGSKD